MSRFVQLFGGRRRWIFYVIVLTPILSGYCVFHVKGIETWEWGFSIVFAASAGSVIATEITFAQIKLRPKDLVSSLLNELSHTPQGMKLNAILDKLHGLVENEKNLEEWKQIIKQGMEDLKEVLEFIHAFAERQRRLKQEIKAEEN